MSKTELTPGEKKLLSLVNMKKLATIGEYKTAASANTCWYNLKKKLFDTPNPSTTTSSSSSPATQANAVNLTPADLKLLNLIWQCLDGDAPKVDNKKLAQLGGYKTTASANTCWYNLRKKLFASQDGNSATGPGTAAAGSVSSSPVGKVRSTPTKKKGKSDAAGLASPASKNGTGSGRMSGGAKKKRAVDYDDDATASAMDETPSKKLKGQKTMMEEGSEPLSTISAAGSEADVKDAEGFGKASDYVVPKLEPMDDMEDVATGEEGMGSQESSEGVVKVKEEDTQIVPSVYADSVTSTTAAVAATDGEEQGDEDAGVRFFQQMREFAEE
ncbi:hypothetical protein D0869_08849 [Hortaea werneckii]|uniref:Uncharacterized protein n=1 Tax=Hortaea werneckii TaxID=91943 RepID=A0A3M6WJH2_HORWE|nr:hypothetical protein D0869_08849 [Hortaea werneckii]RMY07016.1 hypothetical protein D0868_05568 [Hortaea werneckii]RMY10536.1 hypothetical protein D0867_08366 [Hortaea werneckii]RMY36467.1 hypothetical protein D0866_03914 [Hortaea werneckii]